MNKTLCYLKWNYIFNILCMSQALMVLIELKSKIKFRIEYIFFHRLNFQISYTLIRVKNDKTRQINEINNKFK